MSEEAKKPDDETTCEVCGQFKLSHEEFCRDCDEFRASAMEARRRAARLRRFGGGMS